MSEKASSRGVVSSEDLYRLLRNGSDMVYEVRLGALAGELLELRRERAELAKARHREALPQVTVPPMIEFTKTNGEPTMVVLSHIGRIEPAAPGSMIRMRNDDSVRVKESYERVLTLLRSLEG